MHQTLFVINTLFHRNESLGAINSLNIIKLINNHLGLMGVLSPDFTKNIKFAGRNMRFYHIGNLIDPLNYKFCLRSFLQQYPHISYKIIIEFIVIQIE